jgi:hypothetical protein
MFPAAELGPAVGLLPIAVLLAIAAGSGFFLSRLFRATHPADAWSGSVTLSFPLLALTLTALFLTVQFSLPLSIGLLAALSLIRFRTPVKQPEETAFLVTVVATCVSLGAYKLAFAGALLGAAALISLASRLRPARATVVGGTIEVTLPGDVPADGLFPVAATGLRRGSIESLSMGAPGTRITYRVADAAGTEARVLREEIERVLPTARVAVWIDRETLP